MRNELKKQDIESGPKGLNSFDQRESVAFLLEAGFSIPMGYPTGSAVNEGILNFYKQPVGFSPSGVLVFSKDGTKPDFGYTNNYDKEFRLCIDLIAEYSYQWGLAPVIGFGGFCILA